VQSGFSDQVATTHSLMMNKILPIKQTTLDSEIVGMHFLRELLEDSHSLIYKIFADDLLREKFITMMQDIRTGWPAGGSPFYAVSQKDEGYRLSPYQGSFAPEDLVQGLRQKTIFPTGVMKFFAMMVEGGICPTGGWTQAGYCTDLKHKAVKFLQAIGYEERALALKPMPTEITAMTACWGVQHSEDKVELIDAITVLLNPTKFHFENVIHLTGMQGLLAATPTLYEFIIGQPLPVTYTQLRDVLDFAFVEYTVPFSPFLGYTVNQYENSF